MKVYRQWVPCERNSSYNFIPIFLKLCTCFRHGLEMCMWFGYNRWLNFCHFFHFVNFVIFWPQILWKCIDSGYHVSTTPYTTSCLSLFNFAHIFVNGLKMCMWFGFNPAVNFCHISTLLILSFFAGATSTSPKFDLYFDNWLLIPWHTFSQEQERSDLLDQYRAVTSEAEQYQTATQQLESESSNMRLEIMTKDSELRRIRDKLDNCDREINEVWYS